MDRNKLFKIISQIPESKVEVGRLLQDTGEAKEEMKKKGRERMWLQKSTPLPDDITGDPINGIRAYTYALNNAPIACRRQKGGYEEFFDKLITTLKSCCYVAKRRLF